MAAPAVKIGRSLVLPALLILFAISVIAPQRVVAGEPELEEILVTGSRIARPDFESASPIVTVGQEAFQNSASTSVDQVLNRMPQFVPDVTTTSNNPSNGGQGNVQLRGLGPVATLVLLDGRRLVPANGNGVVDVNVIPPSLIQSVEVITGGGSAVYGSDAVAGVVNFKLRQKFDGLQFDGHWAQTGQQDGEEFSVELTGGTEFADGRGHALGYVGYTRRDSLTQAERDFSKYPLSYFADETGGVGPGGHFVAAGGSSIIEEGAVTLRGVSVDAFNSLFGPYGQPGQPVPYQQQYGFNQDGTIFTLGNRNEGSVVNFRGKRDPLQYSDRRYTYNFAPYNYLQLPLERVSTFGRAGYELESGIELYVQALYVDYSASGSLAPTPARNISFPVSNPYIPADLKLLLDSRPDPLARVSLEKRFTELGTRQSSNQYNVYQITTGARGPLAGSWQFDLYAQYGENDHAEEQTGNALRSRINELLDAPDGGMSTCGEFNLFGIGRISPKCAQYISATGTNESGFKQTVAEASVSGPAMTLPAGDLRLAAGIQYKRDEYFYRADPDAGAINPQDGLLDLVGFNASDDVAGAETNTDVYLEALVPLLAGMTGVEKLDLDIGYRHSEYRAAGGADTWKGELLYQPVTQLRLRASVQQAVRAPSVSELYLPQLPTEWSADAGAVQDPCEAGSPQRALHPTSNAQIDALCLAQGMPAAVLPTFADQDHVHLGVSGGNPDLAPETAQTVTFGLVLAPATDKIPGVMQVSLDWYRIKVDNAIAQVSADSYIPQCFETLTNPTLDPGNVWCSYFSRDQTSGEIIDVRDILTNIEGYEASGIDLQLDWSFPLGPGTVGVNTVVSWMDELKELAPEGVPAIDDVGYVGALIGGSTPEWKGNVTLHYDWQSASVGTQLRYIGSMRDFNRELDYGVPSYEYVDLFADYKFAGSLAGLTVRAGVDNVADKGPPLLPSPVAANTDPSQYDVLGRRFYMGVTYHF